MLIDDFVPRPDAGEAHRVEIGAPPQVVYDALWTTDLGSSPIIKGLLGLRSLPAFVRHPTTCRPANRKITLQTIIASGFGVLAEDSGHEIVLGVAGPFWRPVGNLLPFKEENFHGPVPAGAARAVWNFAVRETSNQRTLLSTETRIVCGERSSRRKFRAYWFFVRPFSGLIRILMLRAVKRACEGQGSNSLP
jgi:hypothetical protein